MSDMRHDALAGEQQGFSWFAALLPLLLTNGLLILFLYGPFLYDQSVEIARTIQIAEIDLNSYLDGRASDLGAFMKLSPKIALFTVLLVLWLVFASLWVFQMAPGATPKPVCVGLAALAAAVTPAIFLFKYQTSWVTALAPLKREGFTGFPTFTVAVIVVSALVLAASGLRFWTMRETRNGRFFYTLFWIGVVLYAGVSLVFIFRDSDLALAMGTINIVMMFVLLFFLILCGTIRYSYERAGPWPVLLFFAYVVGLGAFAQYREVPQNGLTVLSAGKAGAQTTSQPSAGQFERWLQARRSVSDSDFPVLIVAASGGGLRAAMRTAYFLEHLRLHCPAASRHIFAISAVSGGAFGALIYTAKQKFLHEQHAAQPSRGSGETCRLGLTDRLQREEEAKTPLLDTFFQTEIIPPIVGAGLFSDLFQRMVPPRLLPPIDRSQAFKDAFSQTWQTAVDKVQKGAGTAKAQEKEQLCSARDLLTCSSERYWSPDGELPLLVFNATSATNGKPIILSNIDADLLDGLNFVDPPLRLAHGDISSAQPSGANFRFSLLSGASASAGFPIALPATVFEDVGGRRHMLVDGGYFDNSGLATAVTIKQNIERRLSPETVGAVKIVLIYLRATEEEKKQCADVRARSAAVEGSASRAIGRDPELAHADALFNARISRSEYTHKLISELEASATDLLQFEWEIHQPPLLEDGKLVNDCAPYAPLAFYFSPTIFQSYRKTIYDQMLASVNNSYFFNQLEKIIKSSGP